MLPFSIVSQHSFRAERLNGLEYEVFTGSFAEFPATTTNVIIIAGALYGITAH